ncbi:hypothetical protein [Sphingobium fuliginis]|uniref:Uncharacterized protein n=1 Tax=Sphingobium fuliginis ATCC 27551 TaxID=1208342 RepID=A0A5B8CKN1_SPHSA|nr:hypothetical protein [Sphingobium fuliginis]QDC38707.1 hypothetical protein FIL70_17120 [Sphingobium fuliginis ATCC 27551]
MALPHVSRFQSASQYAEPDYTFCAPVITLEGQHNFRDILQTFADDRTQSGISHYFSLSIWDGGHSLAGHQATTCATLAYTDATASLARDVLTIGEVAFYAFPIKDGRRDATMFALPLANHLEFKDAIRSANILAEIINVKGVVANSYLPTYFFHFAKGAQIEFQPGSQLGMNLIEEFNGAFLNMKRWLA